MDNRVTPLDRHGEPNDDIGILIHSRSSSERREAALRLGKGGGPEASTALILALADDDAGVRSRAAFSLGRLRSTGSLSSLADRLADQGEVEDVRVQAANALRQIRSPQAVPTLIASLGDQSGAVRQHACMALGEIGDPAAVEPLRSLLTHQSWETRVDAASALWEMGAPNADQSLRALLSERDIPDDLKSRIRKMLAKSRSAG